MIANAVIIWLRRGASREDHPLPPQSHVAVETHRMRLAQDAAELPYFGLTAEEASSSLASVKQPPRQLMGSSQPGAIFLHKARPQRKSTDNHLIVGY